MLSLIFLNCNFGLYFGLFSSEKIGLEIYVGHISINNYIVLPELWLNLPCFEATIPVTHTYTANAFNNLYKYKTFQYSYHICSIQYPNWYEQEQRVLIKMRLFLYTFKHCSRKPGILTIIRPCETINIPTSIFVVAIRYSLWVENDDVVCFTNFIISGMFYVLVIYIVSKKVVFLISFDCGHEIDFINVF